MERDTDTNYARAEHDTPVQGNTGNLMTVQSPNCEITPYLDHGIQRVEPAVQLDQKNNDYYLRAMEGYLGNIKTWKHKKLLLTLAEGFVTGLGSFILEATDNGMGVLMILAALLGKGLEGRPADLGVRVVFIVILEQGIAQRILFPVHRK